MMFLEVIGFFKLAKQFGTIKVINNESVAISFFFFLRKSVAISDKVKIAISIK